MSACRDKFKGDSLMYIYCIKMKVEQRQCRSSQQELELLGEKEARREREQKIVEKFAVIKAQTNLGQFGKGSQVELKHG